MTLEIAMVLGILLISMIIFVTEKLPADLTALFVLAFLAFTGLVDHREAFSGFGNPAVITVWAMFILSESLTRTGIADKIGRQVMRLSGDHEIRIIAVLMFFCGTLSAFMNNIGVAALMLPVAMDIARKTNTSPARLLIPLAFSSLLGGLTSLIGTPPNLLASNALVSHGLEGFGLFDFAPVGLTALFTGIAFLALVGRHFLPNHQLEAQHGDDMDACLHEQYELKENTIAVRLPADSILVGKSLAEIRFGSAIELSVLTITRGKDVIHAPEPATVLMAGDLLVILGDARRFTEDNRWRKFFLPPQEGELAWLDQPDFAVYEFELTPTSRLIGTSPDKMNPKNKKKLVPMAVRRKDKFWRTLLNDIQLQDGDFVLLYGHVTELEKLSRAYDLAEGRPVSLDEVANSFKLEERTFCAHISEHSPLINSNLEMARLQDSYGLRVLSLIRDTKVIAVPGKDIVLKKGDRLFLQGAPDYLDIINALYDLDVENDAIDADLFETKDLNLGELVLAPRSSLWGKSPEELSFKSRYGLTILAIWRGGKVFKHKIRKIKLQFGDGLLVFGPVKKLSLIERRPDFMLLTPGIPKKEAHKMAPRALIIMALVLIPVLLGKVHIATSAVMGCALMVLTGCLSMQEAYRAIDWKSVFLIAGMLPLGTAMDKTGTAAWLAFQVRDLLEGFGPWAVLVGLYVITAVATAIIPTAALVVIMAPITITICTELGISAHAGMMAIAMAASASFTSPIAHPANILVMGPGGYQFRDYVRVGLPLTILIGIVVFMVLPIFWPL